MNIVNGVTRRHSSPLLDFTALEWQAMALIERGDTHGARVALDVLLSTASGQDGAPSPMCLDLLVATYEWDFDMDSAVGEADRLMHAYPANSPFGISASLSRAALALNVGEYDLASAILVSVQRNDAVLDFDTVAWFLQLKSQVEVHKGNYAGASHLALQAADIARSVSRGLGLSARLASTGSILLECGLPREARDNAIACLTLAEDVGQVTTAGAAAFAAFVSHCVGDAIEARRFIRLALDVRPVHAAMELLRSAVGVLIGLSTADADLVAASRDDDLVERTLRLQGWYLPFATLAAYHRLYRSEGRFEIAASVLNRSAHAARSIRGLWPLLFEIAEFGDASAITSAKAIIDRCDQRPSLFAAHLALFDALIARREHRTALAVELAETSSRALMQFGLRYLAARALEVAGRFNEAYQIYIVSGFAGDAKRITAPRRSRGRPFRNSSISDWHRELCRLIAAGQTNGEVAARVGLSPRTIERRIGDLYAMAGVTTRTELCTLIGKGWLP